MLTELHELEAEWQRQGAPIAGLLRPGLTEAELDGVAAQLGVSLPPEVRQLWSWHDGTHAEPGQEGADIGPGGFIFHSTEDVVEHHRWNMEVHATSPEPELLPDWFWHRSWVPFMTVDAHRLYIDCDRQTSGGDSPVRAVPHDWVGFDTDVACSLASAVSLWVWLLREGHFAWNPATGCWDAERLTPLFARWSG
jgi:cell wall assembly regulator SMI1